MPLLTAHDIAKAYGVSTILGGAELHLARGEKVGLVGRNGAGKSTLLRILAGVEQPDGGDIAWRNDTHVAYLAQNPEPGTAKTLLDVALQGAMRNREPLEAHEALLAAEQALKGLGITQLDMPVAVASGGTMRRAAMAAALLQKPDLLLLDEPTNHLDADTAAWLELQLKQLPSALIMVTHDRYFLNQVVDRIVELRRGKLHSYPGTLQDWLEARVHEEELADRTEHNRKNLLRVELDWLSRSPAARSCKPKARMQRAQAQVAASPQHVEHSVQLPFLKAERLGKTILEAHGLKVGYPDKVLIDDLDLTLQRGDRLGIVGPNGAGKTTLLRTLLGQLPLLAGDLNVGQNTRIVGIDQQRTGLDPSETVRDAVHVASGDYVMIGTEKMHVATYLGMFLFKGGDLTQQVSTLSGGEKFRLLLARRLQEPSNVLVLDEPSNDLDFETLEVLEEALLQYPGCLLVVSHDRAFLDRVCTGILNVTGRGNVELHAGNYTDFLLRTAAQKKQERAVELAQRVERPRPRGEAPPKLTFSEEKELAGIEASIELAEARVTQLEEMLASPEVVKVFSKLQEATSQHDTACRDRDVLYARWQQLDAKDAAWKSWKSL